jgi:8-oxo-dGTP diphosphatase
MKYGREISAGGVLYRQADGAYQVALIKLKNGTVNALPKGLVNRGERAEDAARREVSEETGMSGEVEAPLGSIDYYYYSRDRDTRFYKTVYFFLLRYLSGSESDHDWEVEGVSWVPAEEARRLLSYKGEREVMDRALEVLREKAAGNSAAKG